MSTHSRRLPANPSIYFSRMRLLFSNSYAHKKISAPYDPIHLWHTWFDHQTGLFTDIPPEWMQAWNDRAHTAQEAYIDQDNAPNPRGSDADMESNLGSDGGATGPKLSDLRHFDHSLPKISPIINEGDADLMVEKEGLINEALTPTSDDCSESSLPQHTNSSTNNIYQSDFVESQASVEKDNHGASDCGLDVDGPQDLKSVSAARSRNPTSLPYVVIPDITAFMTPRLQTDHQLQSANSPAKEQQQCTNKMLRRLSRIKASALNTLSRSRESPRDATHQGCEPELENSTDQVDVSKVLLMRNVCTEQPPLRRILFRSRPRTSTFVPADVAYGRHRALIAAVPKDTEVPTRLWLCCV